MKKIIFIDNDNESRALQDVSNIRNFMRLFGGVPENILQDIEIIPDFHKLSTDKMYDILFSGENCICSWSMYTATHYGSLQQMLSLLKAAGRNQVCDMLYIDGSGMIERALERNIYDTKDPIYLLNAIETNNIISFDIDKEICYRLRVEIKLAYENPFKRELINISNLLNIPHEKR